MNFRGDTMNSFRSLFGHEMIVQNGDGIEVQGFKGLRRFGVENELFDKVCKFWTIRVGAVAVVTHHCAELGHILL